MQPAAPAPAGRAEALAVLALLALLVAFAFAPVAGAFFIGDDFLVLEVADLDRGPARFLLPQYAFLPGRFEAIHLHGRPLLLFSFAVQKELSGLDPLAFRAVNLLLHLAASWLVWALAREALGARRRVALLAAALFALHPEHQDAVAWIAGRGAPLAGALVLAGLLAWTRGRRGLALAALLPALLVYESAVAAVLLVPALSSPAAARSRAFAALAGATVVFSALQLLALPGADGPRLEPISALNLLRYPAQLAWPFFDSPRFAFWDVGLKTHVRERLPLYAALSLGAAALAALLLARALRRGWRPALARAWLAFGVALLPALAHPHFAPRAAYLACAFFAIALAAALGRSRAGVALLLVYGLALGLASRDEGRMRHEAGELAAGALAAAAAGRVVDPPLFHRRMLPVFVGAAGFERARRLFPAGPPARSASLPARDG